MRVKEMHPLCCISLESPAIGDRSPEPTLLSRTGSLSVKPAGGSDGGNAVRSAVPGSESATSVAGVLYKWTNYSKGWRSRWFLLHNGVLSYSKIRFPENLDSLPSGSDFRVIGEASSPLLSRLDSRGSRKHRRTNAVHLKVSSFRESRSDDRKFYIFTASKTLHLRTHSRSERVAWIEALASSRSVFFRRPRKYDLSVSIKNVSISTEALKKRLIEEGVDESLVKDCEQIMLSEFCELQGHLEVLCEERSNLLDTIRQLDLEAGKIEVDATGVQDSDYRLAKHEYSGLGCRKYNSIEYSTTESSDDIEKQELDEVSDEENIFYYDTEEHFAESPMCRRTRKNISDSNENRVDAETQAGSLNKMHSEQQLCNPVPVYLCTDRRKKLPDPVEKEKGVSLWSMIKDNVGKDLTRVCLPVYFNEPLSSLQKCCEDLEYSYLLDRAYEEGKAGNSALRVLNVAAFAVSGYASSKDRPCKPFNPLLGETYEADYPEKGIRFFSEKVSHHPTLIACHCEGRGWKFWGDSNLKAKFWGQSIQLDPVGVLTLEFDDGEIFQWSKVTTSINNLILGKVYCDHHGLMHIQSNRQYSCKLKFKGHSILDRNPHQVHGVVEDSTGRKVASLFGKWDESMYFVMGSGNTKQNYHDSMSGDSLLWKRSKPPHDISRYNLTSFAITLNELTPGLQEKLPPTDSRLRPDQRHLENGEFEKANSEKLRLEQRQRMSRKLQENGWKPRWFQKDDQDGSYHYIGGYWEAREHGQWDGCPDIFGDFSEDVNNCSVES
ncbi:Oxysterol-binding protein- protein 2A [Dionaea muscipula]